MIALLSLLQNIQQHSQQLFDCLKQEKLAIDNNQLEQLGEIANQKQQLLNQLNKLDKQRAEHSNINFNDFIATSNDANLIKLWGKTRKAISECQQQNEINGRLIKKRSQINHDILTVLAGKNESNDETYNAKGNQTNNSSLLGGIKA